MKETPSIRKNFLMNALLSVSSFLFPLITFPYASRTLLAEGIGKANFAISFVAYFGMIARLGIPTYGVRACAKVRDDPEKLSRTAQELLIINLVMGVVAYAALAVCMAAVPRVRQDRELFAVISVTIFLDAIGMEWLYKALEQYSYITVRSLIFKFIAAGATFLMIHSPADVIPYGIISIFAASASNVLNFFNAHRYIRLKPVGGYDFRKHLRAVAVFFAMACATTIYTHLDAVMLGFMKGDVAVGYYNAAVKIKTVLVSAVTALGAVLLPRASWYIEQGKTEAFRTMTGKAIRFVLLVAAPLTLYFMIFAREAILVLSGGTFLASVPAMRIIMPTVMLIGLTNVMGIQILVPLGREKTVLYSEIAGAAVDLALNLILIPSFGPAGAAAGTLAAEAAVLVVQYLALRKDVKGIFTSFHWGRMGIALVLGSLAAGWTLAVNMRPIFTLIISGVCFFGVYGGFLLWRKEELVSENVERVIRAVRRRHRA